MKPITLVYGTKRTKKTKKSEKKMLTGGGGFGNITEHGAGKR